MTQTHKKIKEALKKHNYEVIISSDGSDTNSIKASFPQRKQEPAFIGFWAMYEYLPELDPSSLFFRIGNGEYSAINCPKYSLREVLFMDIDKVCDAIGYSENLVSFYFDKKEIDRKSFKNNVLFAELTEEELQKQLDLESLCKKAKKEKFEKKHAAHAKILGVLDAYEVLKDMYFSEL